MKREIVSEIIGWRGAFAIIIAYILASFNIISVNTLTYQILNMAGAFGIVYISFKKNAYQPAILNIIWAIIAIIAITKLLG